LKQCVAASPALVNNPGWLLTNLFFPTMELKKTACLSVGTPAPAVGVEIPIFSRRFIKFYFGIAFARIRQKITLRYLKILAIKEHYYGESNL
jgi:hypothetical protein